MQDVRRVGDGVQRSFVGVDLRRPKGYSPAPAPPEVAAACPRCESTNTKFCYYNNYSTAQPRHYCKSCRRYWTKGGTLRSVPVGGGTRKSAKRSSSSSKSKSEKRRHTISSKSNSDNSSTLTVAERPYPSVDNPNEQQQQEQLFPEAEPVDRSFTSMIEADADAVAAAIGFGLADPGAVHETKLEETQLPVFDWPGSVVDGNLFDIGSYLNQNHWLDPDPTLFFH